MAEQDAGIFVARAADKAAKRHILLPHFGNRHGLVAGATGTGKTVTLQRLAEGFSALGVPVFLADVKGDLAGISQPGGDHPKLVERARLLGMTEFGPDRFPAIFWDVFGAQGHPIRTTISELGPLLLSRMLELNDVQEGVLNIAFKVADDEGLLLLDLKDLRAMLSFIGEHADEVGTRYGNVSKTSLGAIQRQLLVLEQQGAEQFLGEPALELADMMICDAKGRGCINVLAADKLMQSPRLYATFLLWLLSELFEQMPEIGDQPKPKFVFFFDEAHLLFDDAPRALMTKIEQVVRLIRSKGVGVFFITQNPLDIPDTVLGQLGNRIQHALRAFTPRDQKAVRAAADTFRPNPRIDTSRAITELGVGEALISLLEGRGEPGIVDRALVAPPCSRLGPVSPAERRAIIEKSPVFGKYEDRVDRHSAYEKLAGRASGETAIPPSAPRQAPGDVDWGSARRAPQPPAPPQGPWGGQRQDDGPMYRREPEPRYQPKPAPAPRPVGRPRDSLIDAMAKSAVRTVGSTIGREIIRGVLGSILGKR